MRSFHRIRQWPRDVTGLGLLGLALCWPVVSLADGYDGPQSPAIEFPAAPWPSGNTLCSVTTVLLVGPRLWDPRKLSAADQEALKHGARPTEGEVEKAGAWDVGGTEIDLANGLNVVDYYTNKIASHERPRDKVQACLIYVPSESECPTVSRDQRGRWYRIYDYKAKAAYRMQNSEHSCGGA